MEFVFFATVCVASAQGAAPFSHRVHLQLKLQCVGCHRAALTSARVEDNLLPGKQVCLPCHKQVAIPPPPHVAIAKFSHVQHSKLGNVAPVLAAAIKSKAYLSAPDDILAHLNSSNPCVACHRGLEVSDAVTKAALPQMADCLVCHNKIDPPFSCDTCHAKGVDLRPASHLVEGFIDRHSSTAMNKSDCAVCHGRRFTCMGCHQS